MLNPCVLHLFMSFLSSQWFIKDKQYHRFLTCEKEGSCEITVKTRNDCKGCRYNRAASLGVCKSIPVRIEKRVEDEEEEVEDLPGEFLTQDFCQHFASPNPSKCSLRIVIKEQHLACMVCRRRSRACENSAHSQKSTDLAGSGSGFSDFLKDVF